MTTLWFAWLLSTIMAIVFGYLWLRTLRALTDVETERDEAVDRLIFAAPAGFREVPVTKPPNASHV